MTKRKLIKLLKYLSQESLLNAEDYRELDDFTSSMKSYGCRYAYENLIDILKDKSYRKHILLDMKKEEVELNEHYRPNNNT